MALTAPGTLPCRPPGSSPPSSPGFGRVPTDPQHPGGFLRRAQAGKPHPASKCCRRNRRDAALQDSPATDKWGWDEPWAQGPSAPHNTPQGCTPQQHTPLRVHLQVQGQDTGSAPLCHPQWVWGTQPGTVLPSQLLTAPGHQGNPQHRSIPFHPPLEPISIPLPSSSAQKPPSGSHQVLLGASLLLPGSPGLASSWDAATSLGETCGVRGDGAEVGAERSRKRRREGEMEGWRKQLQII